MNTYSMVKTYFVFMGCRECIVDREISLQMAYRGFISSIPDDPPNMSECDSWLCVRLFCFTRNKDHLLFLYICLFTA